MKNNDITQVYTIKEMRFYFGNNTHKPTEKKMSQNKIQETPQWKTNNRGQCSRLNHFLCL